MIGLIFWVGVALIAYVYVGYPALVIVAARLRPEPRQPEHHTLPSVTLIVAAYNEEAVIGRKIEECLALEYPADRLEVILAADGSDDRTVDIANAFDDPRLTVMHRPERRGKLAAIERAALAATGDVVAYSDANNMFTPTALRELVVPFADPGVGMTVGRKTVRADNGLGYSEGLYWRYESVLRKAETRLGICAAWNGEIMAVRRDLLEPAPAGIVNDDAWMALAVLQRGARIAYAPAAVSIEQVSSTTAEEAERRTRMFAGIWQLLSRRLIPRLPWRRPLTLWALASHKLLRPVVPFGFAAAALSTVAALVASPAGGLADLAAPWSVIAAGGQVAFYGLALSGDRLTGVAGKIAFVPRFLLMANVAAIRGLVRQLRGGQSVVWNKAERPATAEPRA